MEKREGGNGNTTQLKYIRAVLPQYQNQKKTLKEMKDKYKYPHEYQCKKSFTKY